MPRAFRLPGPLTPARQRRGRGPGKSRGETRAGSDTAHDRAGGDAGADAGARPLCSVRIPQLLRGHLVIFANDGPFDTNSSVAKNNSRVSGESAHFFKGFAAASLNSPMRRD